MHTDTPTYIACIQAAIRIEESLSVMYARLSVSNDIDKIIIIIIFMVDGIQFSVAVGDILWCVCDTCFVVNWQHNWDKRVSMYKLACLMFIRTEFAVIGNNIYLATCICVHARIYMCSLTPPVDEMRPLIRVCLWHSEAQQPYFVSIVVHKRNGKICNLFHWLCGHSFDLPHFSHAFWFSWRQIWIFSLIIISAESPAGTFMMVALLCACYQCESVARESCKNTCVTPRPILEWCIWMLKTVERSKTSMTWSGFNPTNTRTTLSLVSLKSMHK